MFRLSDVPLALMSTPRLQGERVYLRAPSADDWREWAELRAASRAYLTPWEPTWGDDALTRDAYRRRLRHYMQEWRAGEGYTFFIFLSRQRRLAGGISLSNVRRGVAQSASVGYWMGEAHAGQGIMTESLCALLPFIFDELRLNRLEAACLPSNAPSRAVLRKVGFREEGIARHYLKINGRWHDHLLFGLLVGDYRALYCKT